MNSITNLYEKIKGLASFRLPHLRTLSDDLFLGLIIILVAFGSFGLGRLSKIEASRMPIQIENEPLVTAETFAGVQDLATGGVLAPKPSSQSANIIGSEETRLVGSKNGTKYYYPWCSGVSRIAEANRIYFPTKSDAEAQGYTPSSTCKGL